MVRARSMGDETKGVGYIRVSTEDQHLGPEAQRGAIERWVAVTGVEVVEWHTDHGVSGAAPLEKRSGLLAALNAIRLHRAGRLVVASVTAF